MENDASRATIAPEANANDPMRTLLHSTDPLGPLPATPLRQRMLAALGNRTFRSLRHRDYRLYFLGQIVSFTGSWMQSAALMWLVFDLTADPIWPSLLLVAQVGPTLLFGTLGGALADRFAKRTLIAITQSSFLIVALLLLALTATNAIVPWLLFAVMACSGVVQAIDLPARLSFVPDLVPRDDLINAISLNALLFNAARAVGPALAGVTFLIADAIADAGWSSLPPVRIGAMFAFGFNVVSFLAVLWALSRMTQRGLPSPGRGKASATAGIRLAWRTPFVRGLLLRSGMLCVFAWPALTLFPAYTKLVLKHAEKEYSLLVSALGLGALGAALTAATFSTPPRRFRFLCVGACGCTIGLAGLALSTTLFAALSSAATLGFGLILYLSTGQSALQLTATDETRGRMMALWAMMLSASAPLGHLIAGRAAQSLPIDAVFAVMATGSGCVALGLWWFGRPAGVAQVAKPG